VRRTHFDGSTYDPSRDHARLTSQLRRVLEVLWDEKWHTISELAGAAGGMETSVSARIRDLRKPKFGGRCIHARRAGNGHKGLWEYRLERGEETNVETGSRARLTKEVMQTCIAVLERVAPSLMEAEASAVDALGRWLRVSCGQASDVGEKK
jgi:hypothetical protein